MKKHIIILVIVLIAILGVVGYLDNKYSKSDIVEQYQEAKEQTEPTLEQRVERLEAINIFLMEDGSQRTLSSFVIITDENGKMFPLSNIVADNQRRITELEK